MTAPTCGDLHEGPWINDEAVQILSAFVSAALPGTKLPDSWARRAIGAILPTLFGQPANTPGHLQIDPSRVRDSMSRMAATVRDLRAQLDAANSTTVHQGGG